MRKVIQALILALCLWLLTRTQQAQRIETVTTIRLPAIQPIPFDVFIDSCARLYRIPSEVIRGIGWNESHLGESSLARRSNNLFGIKCGDGWKGKRCGEYRAYDSKRESVLDFCRFITHHYFHLIGKPLNQWRIKGYAEKPYKF